MTRSLGSKRAVLAASAYRITGHYMHIMNVGASAEQESMLIQRRINNNIMRVSSPG